MTAQRIVTAESSQCYRLFGSREGRISLSPGGLRIDSGSGRLLLEISIDSVAKILVDQSWFWHRLKIESTDGQRYSIGGLEGTAATVVRDGAMAMAEQMAREELVNLARLDDRRVELFDGRRYVRRGVASEFQEVIASTLRRSKGIVRRKLAEAAPNVLSRIEGLERTEGLERARDRANEAFIQNNVPAVKLAAKSDFGITLTDEQAVAIATDEEATLVLAGAGTGKTAVITGKVAHLVRNEGIAPEDILVLAFNRNAAREIRDRLPPQLKDTKVLTFHAFGYVVIGRDGKKPSISKLAADEQLLQQAVDKALNDILGMSDQSEEVQDFLAYHRAPYRSPFEFENQGKYYEYVRDWEPRTLSGDRVKSLEEVEVANFLTLNGIEFVYEEPYQMDTATSDYRQYQPDFYLPEYGIYIEHFALDENGNPPREWGTYKDGVEWKRGIHARHGTRLIETYSWQRRKGILRRELQKQLAGHGVVFKKVSFLSALRRLAEWIISWLAQLLTKFLNHVKTNGFSPEQLRERALASSNPIRNRSFLRVFEKVQDRYESMLRAEGTVDFHDLINDAAALIRGGREPSRFRYVLVDEFQDISAGRMRLLDALGHRNNAYFVVGDDWQSIYRFAGSDVSLVKDCGQYLGHVQHRELTETFRFGEGILAPSSAFVQRNPEQTQRAIRTVRPDRVEGITIVAVKGVERALHETFRDIQSRLGAKPAKEVSVLVLGRYRNSEQPLSAVGRRTYGFDVRFSTVHRAKGQEADYVIVLDLENGRRGFPAKIDDDPLLEMVLPAKSATGLPFAEERRLFYVAMTRARRGAYLVTDDTRPSEFVTEIRKHHPGVRQLGSLAVEQFPNCPKCTSGQLVPSQSGDNLRCTNYPMCDRLAPRCDQCRVGYLVAVRRSPSFSCTNPKCDRRGALCPKCEVGMLTKKQGRFGEFWGCTEYWSEPPCRYIQNIATYSSDVRA